MNRPLPAALTDGKGWPWEAQTIPRSVRPELPTITVVTPSYNQGSFIEATIRSVLLQGYPKLEYIIMDGGSNDRSIDIIRHYEPWLTSWVSGPDRGQSHAINSGFEKGTGELIAWLNSDDSYTPDALWIAAEAAAAHPEHDAFAGGSERFDVEGRSLGIFMPPALTHQDIVRWTGHHLPQPSCFFRRGAFERAGRLDESLYYLMDYDLWLRMSRQSRFLRMERVLSREIRHPQAKNVAKPAELIVAQWMIKHRYDVDVARSEMVATLSELFRVQKRAEAVAATTWYRLARPLIKRFFP